MVKMLLTKETKEAFKQLKKEEIKIHNIEKQFINGYMATFLYELNRYFITHNSISKKEFMDMQNLTWSKYKKTHIRK